MHIFFALLYRHLMVTRTYLRSRIIDGLIVMVISVLVFSRLLPLLGMPASFIGPQYASFIIFYLLILADDFGFRLTYEINQSRLTDYYTTIASSISWVFLSYLIHFVIEAALISFIPTCTGIVLLGPALGFAPYSWLAFFIMYFSILMYLGSLFIFFYTWYEFEWLTVHDNLWPRRLTAFINMSVLGFPWYALYNFAPHIAHLTLLNPLTYLVEGLRSVMLIEQSFIPTWICFTAVIFCTIINYIGCKKAIIKRLDPVY